ncbi:MAG TPA: hypothetical protein VFS14_03270 [Candidatus Saccharimonadales bacterium]|nr:hypothetical protein [Candidatus Saccharimonadales bacterium]
MRISTKMLASLLLVTAVMAAAPGIGKKSERRQETQFDRILQRHDRKGELRAEVLGISAPVFRELHKKLTFAEIVRRSGFASERAFRLALLGKLKSELRQRGWSSQRIERYVVARSSRIG